MTRKWSNVQLQVIINMFVPAEGARGSTKARLSAQCQRNRLPQFHTCITHEASSVLNSFVIRRNSSLTHDLTNTPHICIKRLPTGISKLRPLSSSCRDLLSETGTAKTRQRRTDVLFRSSVFFHKGALVSRRPGLSDQ